MQKATIRMRRRFGKAEEFTLQFFQGKIAYGEAKSPNKIKKLFSKLDYILFEGSLKAAIVASGVFSPLQVDYLHAHTDALCQCTEFFMNGMKFGHQALGLSYKDYIIPLDPDKPFVPLAKSVVLYPASYGELYSLESRVANCFKSCFLLEGGKEEEITVWEVTCK